MLLGRVKNRFVRIERQSHVAAKDVDPEARTSGFKLQTQYLPAV